MISMIWYFSGPLYRGLSNLPGLMDGRDGELMPHLIDVTISEKSPIIFKKYGQQTYHSSSH